MTTATKDAKIVVVDWKDVVSTDTTNTTLHFAIQQAYGCTGTGVLAIRNVPGFVQAKKRLLPQAHTLAHLPKDTLKELEDPQSLYNAGWSHGHEQLKKGVPANYGSFYFNPVSDVPGTPELRAIYPYSYPCNVWPSKKSTLPDLQDAAQELGKILLTACVELSKHLDALAGQSLQDYRPVLYPNLQTTDKVKGRLLYYFPNDKGSDESTARQAEDSWIGWHNDSGFLTALAGELFVNHQTGKAVDPDPAAGLYVVDRDTADTIVRVHIPSDCLAIQMGECTQIVTAGAVQATPHCVKGSTDPALARISLACFVDVPPTFPLASPTTRTAVLESSCTQKVPPLDTRWSDGMTFGDFLKRTFEEYYK